MKLNGITLLIAGFKINLQSETNVKIGLEEGYLPFILEDNRIKPDIFIKIKKYLSKRHFNENHLIFEAKEHEQKYFSVYREKQNLEFTIYKQQDSNEIQQIAYLDENLTNWTIFAQPSKPDNKIYPLLYPMGPLILYYLTVKYNAIMLHASGILDGEKGKLFSGFSGTGKSTMADLWMQAGSTIINDDRLIICRNKNGFTMHNTPMFYIDSPKEAPLHSIFLINHSSKNKITKLIGANAVSRLMAYCIQHGYDKNFIQHHLEFLSKLCDYVEVYEVGFKPNNHIIDFIKNHAD